MQTTIVATGHLEIRARNDPAAPAVKHQLLPRFDDDDPSAAKSLTHSEDPYYTNQDIAILHDVVAAAQEQLERGPTPKPLPAAALFKAYDEILPKHGIDPDSDHHLSAFVFRIGGERGHGSIADKFQTILARMGILLEFADNATTVSIRSSQPPSPSTGRLLKHLPHRFAGTALDQNDVDIDERGSQVELSLTPPTNLVEPVQEEDGLEIARSKDEEAHRAGQKAAALAALVRWRNAAAQSPGAQTKDSEAESGSKHAKLRSPGALGERASPQAETSFGRRQTLLSPRGFGLGGEAASEGEIHSGRPGPLGDSDSLKATSKQRRFGEGEASSHEVKDAHTSSMRLSTDPPGQIRSMALTKTDSYAPEPDTNHDQHAFIHTVKNPGNLAEHQVMAGSIEHDRLMKRATRAREIFLSSKVFNIWADRTARRVEREAVARRHMLRFRCFHGWSHIPSSRDPAIDQLRAHTAVQKLQRAVAYQEAQLRLNAAAIAHEFQLRSARRLLDHWLCCCQRDRASRIMANRDRLKWSSFWLMQSAQTNSLGLRTRVVASRFMENDSLDKWHVKSTREAERSAAAKNIGRDGLLTKSLRNWWNQSEVARRSQVYKGFLLSDQTNQTFSDWLLLAESRAFAKMRARGTATRTLDAWLALSAQSSRLSQAAKQVRRNRAKNLFPKLMSHVDSDASTLLQLQSRARLFIGATKLLNIFEHAARSRREQEWEITRQQLMMRYQQASSARKRRKFFGALDHWQLRADQERDLLRQQAIALENHHGRLRKGAVEVWKTESDVQVTSQARSTSHHLQKHLILWATVSSSLEQQIEQAWTFWAVRRQRQSLKEWSISSLQQGGQAHTAHKHRERHEREQLSWSMDNWKRLSSFRNEDPSQRGFSASQNRSRISPRASWRFGSSWRTQLGLPSYAQESFNPMDTPSRSSSRQLALGRSIPKPQLPRLNEADEMSDEVSEANESTNSDPPDAVYSFGESTSRPWPGTALPSTTPREPVPSHLEQPRIGRIGQTARTTPAPSTRQLGTASRAVAPRVPSRSRGLPVQYLPGERKPRPGLLQNSQSVSQARGKTEVGMSRLSQSLLFDRVNRAPSMASSTQSAPGSRSPNAVSNIKVSSRTNERDVMSNTPKTVGR